MAKWKNSDDIEFTVRSVIDPDNITTQALAERGIVEPTPPTYKTSLDTDEPLTEDVVTQFEEDASTKKETKQAEEYRAAWQAYKAEFLEWKDDYTAQQYQTLLFYGCGYLNEIPDDFEEEERKVYADFVLPEDREEAIWQYIKRRIAPTAQDFSNLASHIITMSQGGAVAVENRLKFRQS